MIRFINMLLVIMLSTGLFILANAQEAQKTTDSEKVQLQDQNQNQGTTRNMEQNRVIHGAHFVDKDGDGFHDYAPDRDRDGIPNGQDADYQGAGKGQKRQNFVDRDGDGIADPVNQRRGLRSGRKGRSGYGAGDGNRGLRPRDGTGFGPGAASGNCDGTGPKGKTQRIGQK